MLCLWCKTIWLLLLHPLSCQTQAEAWIKVRRNGLLQQSSTISAQGSPYSVAKPGSGNSNTAETSVLRRSSAWYLEDYIQITYHYDCPVARRRTRMFQAKAYYMAETGRVRFANEWQIQDFIGPELYDHSPIHYNGWMVASYCMPYPGHVIGVCKHKFHGHLEGEVWPNHMTLRFIDDQDDLLFSPRVSEKCQILRANEACHIEDQPANCDVTQVDVVSI